MKCAILLLLIVEVRLQFFLEALNFKLRLAVLKKFRNSEPYLLLSFNGKGSQTHSYTCLKIKLDAGWITKNKVRKLIL